MNGGVYVYRTRKPAARLRVPLLSFHFAYVGETTSFRHRHQQHVAGGGTYSAMAKPWADLDPRVVLRIPLPPWKWLLRTVETLAILLTWPVYNAAKNRWNPRRISLPMQAMQRRTRDRGDRWFGRFLAVRWYHWTALVAAAAWAVTR